jgi:thymidylate synthase ThyX
VPEKKISQIEFVRSYFLQRPMVIISHVQAKSDLEAAYLTVMGKRLEDSDRAIRKLHGDGFLEKVAKGQYMYNPETSGKKDFDEFTQAEKNEILKKNRKRITMKSLEVDNDDLKARWEDQQDFIIKAARSAYDWAIVNGIAKEQARAVLPEGLIESRLYMNGSLRSWIHYIELRSENGTQKEHQEIARECAKVIGGIFPLMQKFNDDLL